MTSYIKKYGCVAGETASLAQKAYANKIEAKDFAKAGTKIAISKGIPMALVAIGAPATLPVLAAGRIAGYLIGKLFD